jgi:hypothetical protein
MRAFANGSLAILDDAVDAARGDRCGGLLAPGGGSENNERDKDSEYGGAVEAPG